VTTKLHPYDVAISFLGNDESLALQIKKAMGQRVSCFVFTEEQKRLAASDGEVTLNAIFSKEACIVVILHRENWAKTKWTRLEETAIRNRGFDEGYDFLVFVPLDTVSPPEWLPKNRISTKLDPWGIDGLASVIERKIQEYGGTIREETMLDKVRSVHAEIDGHAKRKHTLQNREGTELAYMEYEKIRHIIDKYCHDVSTSIPDWQFRITRSKKSVLKIVSYGHELNISWAQWSSSSKGYLQITMVKKKLGGLFNYPLIFETFKFHINEYDQKGWLDKESQFRTTDEIADKYFSELIDRIKIKRMSF
jgi:hypothetical protein